MAYITSAYVEFRELLAAQIKTHEQRFPERYSLDWFYLSYLKRVNRRAQANPTPQACNGAMRGLTRFYVDQIADGSELAASFEAVLECHRYALRMQRLAVTDEQD